MFAQGRAVVDLTVTPLESESSMLLSFVNAPSYLQLSKYTFVALSIDNPELLSSN